MKLEITLLIIIMVNVIISNIAQRERQNRIINLLEQSECRIFPQK